METALSDAAIRRAGPADVGAIRRIALLTWPHAYCDILVPGQLSYMLEKMYNPAVLQRQMQEEGQIFLIYTPGLYLEPAGFAGLGPEPESLWWKLHKLYLLPFMQKAGGGRCLLHAAEEIARQNGAQGMRLNVNRNNQAVGFYRRLGYEISRQVDIDIGAGFYMNDYIMEKKLKTI